MTFASEFEFSLHTFLCAILYIYIEEALSDIDLNKTNGMVEFS